MATYKIGVISGDDSGPEVMGSTIKILERAVRNSPLRLDFNYEDVGKKDSRPREIQWISQDPNMLGFLSQQLKELEKVRPSFSRRWQHRSSPVM